MARKRTVTIDVDYELNLILNPVPSNNFGYVWSSACLSYLQQLGLISIAEYLRYSRQLDDSYNPVRHPEEG